MYIKSRSLTHHGILGMKWGVRRTPEQLGRARGHKRDNWSDDAKNAAVLRKTPLNKLSNAEIRKLNERKDLEANYHRLNKSAVQKGLAFVTTATAIMGTALTLYNNSNNLIRAGKDVGGKIVEKAGDMLLKDMLKRS